jgi:beta-lactamase regulating signal transducer with metallopeptidase domain
MNLAHRFYWMVSAQIIGTVILIGLLTVLTARWTGPSPLHLIWFLGVPLAIAVLTSTSPKMCIIMGCFLLLCSFATIATTAAIFGLGP